MANVWITQSYVNARQHVDAQTFLHAATSTKSRRGQGTEWGCSCSPCPTSSRRVSSAFPKAGNWLWSSWLSVQCCVCQPHFTVRWISSALILHPHPTPPPCRPICTYNHHHHASPLAVDDNFHRQRAECVRQSWSHCRGGSVRHQNRLCLQWSEQRDQKVPHKLIIKKVLF